MKYKLLGIILVVLAIGISAGVVHDDGYISSGKDDVSCRTEPGRYCRADELKNIITKKVFLTLCTTVRNNVHFIVEWIEYMRMQGVDRFIIYDDESTDSLPLLVPFFRQKDPGLDIHVQPRIINETQYHRQIVSLQHCLDSYGGSTEWLLLSDTDEFFYSPSYPTFRSMLEDIPNLEKEKNVVVQHIHAQCSRFGSSGQVRRQQYRFEQLHNGTVVYRNGCGEQLLVNQVLRGPDPTSYRKDGEKEKKRFDRLRASPVCTNTANRTGTIGCHFDPGKSVIRTRHVTGVAVHYPDKFADGHTHLHSAEAGWLLSPPLPLAWCNHYWFRSRDDGVARATEQWRQSSLAHMMALYDEADLGFYGQVADTLVRDRWGPELARRVRALATLDGDCPGGGEGGGGGGRGGGGDAGAGGGGGAAESGAGD
jgi:hypothetical protein